MKKGLLVLLVLFLVFPLVAGAEDTFDVDGEWFITVLYSNKYRMFDVDDSGTYRYNSDGLRIEISADGDGEAVFGSDNPEYVKLDRLDLANEATLFYFFRDKTCYGYLFEKLNDGFSCFEFEASRHILLYNGKVYLQEESEKHVEYIVSRGSMYIINDYKYTRGKMTTYDKNVFTMRPETDSSESTDKYADLLGEPFYLFISTSLFE